MVSRVSYRCLCIASSLGIHHIYRLLKSLPAWHRVSCDLNHHGKKVWNPEWWVGRKFRTQNGESDVVSVLLYSFFIMNPSYLPMPNSQKTICLAPSRLWSINHHGKKVWNPERWVGRKFRIQNGESGIVSVLVHSFFIMNPSYLPMPSWYSLKSLPDRHRVSCDPSTIMKV